MKIRITLVVMLLLFGMDVYAQQPIPKDEDASKGRTIEGQRMYKLIVQEGENKEEFNRSIENGRTGRGLLADIVSLYRQTFINKTATTTNNWIELGFTSIANSATSKQKQWETEIRKECIFERKLAMQQEILDFYKEPSSWGPLDPTNILFSGLGCKQYIQFPDGTQREVFYISCRLRTDSIGKLRITNHSKFEVIVDTLMFNPSLCDLPNDSLGTNTETRIGFSFLNRKNLTFNIKATITSSWMTQAMQVYNDQTLGEFDITASIDSTQLNNGIFTYSNRIESDTIKKVSVLGDCFLIPRSYIGSFDEGKLDSWGTGQYKVEMQITESCQINEEYYKRGNEWLKEKWQPEWKNIKRRKRSNTFWGQMANIAETQYIGSNWITTWIEPTKTAVLQIDNEFFNAVGTTTQTTSASSMTTNINIPNP